MAVNYLTREQILLVHSIVVDETGGSHGLRDSHIVSSLEHSTRQNVFGKELYPTVFLKASVYVREIIMTHPFIDGNKRTGMSAASVFLENNGYKVVAQKGEIENFAISVIADKLDIEAISAWLKKHSKKIRRSR